VTKHPNRIERRCEPYRGIFEEDADLAENAKASMLLCESNTLNPSRRRALPCNPGAVVAVLAHLLDCANSQESLSSRGHAALTRQDTSCISIQVGPSWKTTIFRSPTEEIG
jgi:hypothetical protein